MVFKLYSWIYILTIGVFMESQAKGLSTSQIKLKHWNIDRWVKLWKGKVYRWPSVKEVEVPVDVGY